MTDTHFDEPEAESGDGGLPDDSAAPTDDPASPTDAGAAGEPDEAAAQSKRGVYAFIAVLGALVVLGSIGTLSLLGIDLGQTPQDETAGLRSSLQEQFPAATLIRTEPAERKGEELLRAEIPVALPLSTGDADRVAAFLAELGRAIGAGDGPWPVVELIDGEQRFVITDRVEGAAELVRATQLVGVGDREVQYGQRAEVELSCAADDSDCIRRAGEVGLAALELVDELRDEVPGAALRSLAMRLELVVPGAAEPLRSTVLVKPGEGPLAERHVIARIAFDAWLQAVEPIGDGAQQRGHLVLGELEVRASRGSIGVRIDRVPATADARGPDEAAAMTRLLDRLRELRSGELEIWVQVRPHEPVEIIR